MAIRFRRSSGAGGRGRTTPAQGDGLGDWWAAVVVIALATTAILALAGSARTGATASPAAAIADPTTEILSSLLTAERSLEEIEEAFANLCREPVLMALELEPDCTTGAMRLEDPLFEGFGGSQLKESVREDVRAAVTKYLERLRRTPAVWESLDAIEIRGHADPRAVRDAYATNLVGSQQRALGVLLFLVGEDGLATEDREDLERLATVSGASFSRPPANCPERSRECYPEWRRVEIIPVMSESLRRDDWSRTVENVQIVTRRAQRKLEANER